MAGQLEELKRRLARLSDLGYASSLAHWDQQTKMPVRGGQARAEMLATLAELHHREFIDAETGRLLQGAQSEVRGADPDSDDARLVALTVRRWEKARRVPGELAAELAHAASVGQEAWVVARRNSDAAAFAPHLKRNVELARRYVETQLGHDGYECAYDVLLDDYEPQMHTAQIAALFDELKRELVPMLDAIERSAGVDDGPLRARVDIASQRRLAREIIGLMGFDESGWRMDDTIHPFAARVGVGDVRITTRFEEGYWPMGLFGSMHECGHGLYEEGISESLRRTPLGSIDSLALHESQSLTWEDLVGRSRPFAEVLAPRLAAAAGGALDGLDPVALYRAVNRVQRSHIRVDADEATYPLHIILRFELEQELIEGELAADDAAEAWRTRFEEYLGIPVRDDAEGILQDVHWSSGLLGYFPTYALGKLIAAQLWECAREQLPDLDAALAAGELGELREWLREHVHRHGARYTTSELLAREAGAPISVGPFVRYLKRKIGDVYGLTFEPSPLN